MRRSRVWLRALMSGSTPTALRSSLTPHAQVALPLSEAPFSIFDSPFSFSTTKASQSERVSHHRDRAERHRGAGDHGAEQSRGGERNADHVVDEGPEEILLHRAHRAPGETDRAHSRAEIATHERDVSGLHC